MSTTGPAGEGGGGGGEEATTIPSTNVEQNTTPVTPVSGSAMPLGSQQQHPPPSPLSGCYLLVVLPEPHTAQHKDLILNRLSKGFLSWDKDSCHVDLEKELLALVAQAPEGEEARNGERLIQYATENLVTEVLIHPQTNTLLQCIRNLLASFTKHRHIIHAGYTFGGNGSWILQDGTFSVADFLDAFSEHEVQRVLRAYENSVTVDIHCAGVGDWATNRLSKEACTRSCRVRVNPDDVLTAGVPAITSFSNYIGQYLVAQTLDQLMEPSDVVGNIRFSHPTLYVFPGGQGDAALFGINGFNMLVDGGFARKACFWDFTRHLDRLDAVLVTRINNSNVGGMSSVLRKKKEMHVYPQIGHFFCNLVERRQSNSPDGDKDIDPLILNLTDIGQEMVVNLRHINLRAHPCYRDPDPINLYHKVGHGTLDMYVLSPSKDSREVREFVVKWHASDSKLFTGSHKKDSNNLTFPIQNLVSICALLVWQPANPEDTITRILFPGSTPQHKIFEGFERLKHLEFLKHSVCSAKSLSPSTSLATLRDKPAKQKLSLIEKESSKKISDVKKEKRETSEVKVGKGGGGGGGVGGGDETPTRNIPQGTPPIIPTKPQGAKIEVKTKKAAENKRIEVEVKEAKESKKIEKELKEVSKKEAVTKKEAVKMEKQTAEKPEKTEEKFEKREEESLRKSDAAVKSEGEKMMIVPPKESRVKGESKKKEAKEARDAKVGGVKVGRLEAVSVGKPKLVEKKAKQQSYAEKKETGVGVKSSPTTPKKSVNGVVTKTEISKGSVQRGKLATAQKATTALPAKSAKDANNRKVVEQKNIEKSAIKETTAAGGMVVGSMAKVSVKAKPMDRKPIGRRGKPVSPIKSRAPGSPAKSTRSTPTTSVKSDKDGVVRKPKGDKGTTDSSTVSTPSGIEPETAARLVEKSLIEKSEDISLDSIESKVLADLKEEREVVEEIEAVLQKAERIEETRKDDRFEGDDEITAEVTDKKQEEDITEEDVTAEIEDAPKKDSLRKGSQELTEEDEYLIVEKEEVYTEDSVQSGEGEQKHILDEAESEKAKIYQDLGLVKEKGEEEGIEEKERDESAEKESTGRMEAEAETIAKLTKIDKERTEPIDLSPDRREQLDQEEVEEEQEVKDVITSVSETKQKAEEKDNSGKKDSDDITKEPSSLSPDKLDSSEKKTTDTDLKPEVDQKEQAPEKLEESQERISTIESGATTTAPTLPEDERIPLDEIKEDIDEKHIIEEVKEKDMSSKVKEEVAATPATLTVTTTASVAATTATTETTATITATATTVTDTALTSVPRAAPAVTAKPDVPMFDVRQAVQCLQRDIVKTPDEVADLPVHEEVDPKLYRMEDFEKDKEEKALPPAPATAPTPAPEPSPAPAPAPAQDVKEPPTPPVKEQKGVFSFFGKVADKFEKGIDKLTKKSKKEHDKDTDEKSSSKSSSPKEAKVQEKALLEDVDMEKMFLKVSKPSEKVEASEEMEPKIDHVKDVTAALRYEEIIKEDTFEHHRPESEPVKDEIVQDVSADVVPSRDKFDMSKDELAKDAKDTKDSQAEKKGEEIIAVAVEEETDEIQALIEEALKKFKTVKDSLRDSLESLDGKIGDESIDLSGEIGAVKDTVKDTMDGVVERLERIKPQMENASPDTREPEKVKFDIPKDEEFEAEYEETAAVEGPMKDIKEAVRDVGEVLAGTAGIDIEDKEKDVTEIVRKVAQVLKGGDFLPEETLLSETTAADRKEVASLTAAEPESPKSPKSPISEYTPVKLDEMSGKHEGKIVVIPTKVGITEEFPQQEQEQVGELLIDETTARVTPVPALTTLKSPDKRGTVQVDEEPCVKITTEKDTISSPKDEAKDVRDAKEICEHILKQDLICKSDTELAPRQVESWKEDVIEAGLEDVCVKEVAKKLSDEEKDREEEVEVPTIGFHQKVSPAKAEIVMVSPGSTPTSPKFVADKIHESTLANEETAIPVKLPAEIKAIVDNVDRLAADIIQQLVTNKTKITIEIIEYITTIKRLPRERVIYIIEELIVRKELSREDVVDNVDMFKLDGPITPQLKMELEEYIINEYVTKGKRITIRVVEEISIKMLAPKTIVIQIIKDIMVKKSIDVSTDDLWESQTEDMETKEGKEESPMLHRVEEKLTASTEKEFATKEEEEEEKMEEEEEVEEGVEEEEEEERISRIDAKEAKEAEAAKVEVTIQAFVSGEQPVSEKEEEDLEEDGFVSIGRKVSKETIDDFEAVEQEYKVCDVPVTSFDDISPAVPQKLFETKEKDYAEEAVEDTASDVVEADEKFVRETKEKIGKERRLDVDTMIDVTLDKQGTKVQDTKERDTAPQLTQVSEALDAVEKYLDEAKEKVDSKVMLVEEMATDISAVVTATSDSDGGELDTFEPVKETGTRQVPSSTISRESSGTEHVPTAFQPMKEEAKSETPDKDEAKQTEMKATRSAGKEVERVGAEQVVDKIEGSTQVAGAVLAEESEREVMDRATDEKPKVQVPLKPEVKLADATGRAVEPKAEELIRDADKAEDAKPQESAEQKDDAVEEDYKSFDESAVAIGYETDKLESTTTAEQMPPWDVMGSVMQQDEPMHETCVQVKVVTVEEKSKFDQDIGSVRRMLVTASSEDGGHETEICPTGSITFTKTPVTPDDSLKDASIKSTPDKDSLLLDKDSLRSVTSSPEKDSISEKSAAEIKDVVGKATPEDSLDKSPVGRHDSQELEDSLEKAGVEEPKKVDSASPSIDAESTTPKSPQRSEELRSLGAVKPPLEADGAEKVPNSDPLAAEKIQPIKLTDEMVTKLPDATVQTQESPVTLTKEISQLKSPDQQLFIDTNSISKLALEAEAAVSTRSPESAGSEDVPPAETDTLSKSPTEKPGLAKSPTGTKAAKFEAFEREITPSEMKEPILEIEKSTTKSSSDKEDEREILGISGEKSHDTTPVDGTIVEDSKVDGKGKGKEPSIDREYGTIDVGETAERDVDDKKLRSPSIGSDKGDLKDSRSSSSDDSGKPSSIANEKLENKESTARSKSPDTSTDKTAEKKSWQVAGDGHDDQLKRTESKVLVEAGDQALDALRDEGKGKVTEIVGTLMSDTSDVPLLSTVQKSSTAVSDTEEEKDLVDRLEKEKIVKQSTTADQQVSLQVTEEYRSDRIKSTGAVSTTDESKPLDITDPQTELAGRKVSSASAESQEAIDRSSSPSVESERHDAKELSEESTGKVRSPSITSAPEELNETTRDRSKSPSIAGESSDLKEVEAKTVDKSRSPSVTSVSGKSKETIGRSKSPSVADDSPDLKDVEAKAVDKSRSPSVTSVTEESKEPMGPSKSPSVVGESVDSKDDDEATTVDKSRSPSVTSVPGAPREAIDDSKSASSGGEPADLKDIDAKVVDKSRSPSVTSVNGKSKETIGRSKSPSVADDSPDLKDVEAKAVDKSRSPSVTSVTEESKEPMGPSKSPSVVGESVDSKDDDEATTVDKSRSSSVTSVPGAPREAIDDSKSASSGGESADVKDIDAKVVDKSRSPSVTSVCEKSKETIGRSKSSSVADDSPDLKDVEAKAVDKSRSLSVTSVTEESKEPMGPSKSPSVVGESVDSKDDDEATTVDKSRSSSVTSVPGAPREAIDESKSASSGGESADLKDIDAKVVDKSRSPSVTSVCEKSKETIGRSKSSSVADDSPDLKDVEAKAVDKSRSPSVTSVTEESKEPMGPSKSPSVVGESVDSKDDDEATTVDKSRSPSVTSVPGAPREAIDDSKSASSGGESADLKDIDAKVVDKSRSSSVTSVSGKSKETIDRSKSPSVADDSPDLKDVEAKAVDKSRSASVTSVTEESEEPMGPSKSPSIVGESVDSKDDDEATTVDKSRSPSVTSVPEAPREAIDDSKPDGLKDVDTQIVDKSRSPSVPSVSSEAKEQVDRHRSESPSAVGVGVDSQATRSKSRSSETKATMERSKSPSVAFVESSDDTKLLVDKSRSPSVTSASVPEEVKESAERSNSPGVASEPADVKKIDPKAIDTLGSGGITITVGECKEMVDLKEVGATTADRSRSSSIQDAVIEGEDRADHSKSPSIAGESPDLKETEIDSKVISTTPGESKEIAEHFESSSVYGESQHPIDVDEAPELKQVDSKATVKVSKSPSTPTFPGESKETTEHSKESPDRKYIEARAIEKSTSPSATGYPIPNELIDQVDGSKSSSSVGESSDLKQVDSKVTESKSRSPSISSSPGESTKSVAMAVERSKSPSTVGESPNLIDVEGKPIDKSRSLSVTSVPSAPTELADRSKSPSIASELPDLKDVEARITDKSRSPSVASVPSETKDQIDRSKSPSIASEMPDLKEADSKSTDKSRSPSIATFSSELKETAKHSKAPSVTGKSPDPKDIEAVAIDRFRSPSVTGYTIPGAPTDQVDRSKSSTIAGESPDLKEVDTKATDSKSRSPSIATLPEESKAAADHSKAPPSVAGESPDPKDLEARAIDTSRSASVTSISGEPKDQVDHSKSPSIAGESPDLKDVDSIGTDKSKSPSIATSPEESKEAADHSEATPLLVGQSPDPKDLEARAIDRSRSPSVTSISGESKGQADGSKSPNTAGETPDLKETDSKATDSKSRSPSISSSPGESKETAAVAVERSKSQSTAVESLEVRAIDKSRSASVTSVASAPTDPADRSKSPSIAAESLDLKEAADRKVSDKSVPPSMPTSPGESPETAERSKSPSVARESPDPKDAEAGAIDKSRSLSAASVPGKSSIDQVGRSKSPSIAGESPELHEADSRVGVRSRSASIPTSPGESKPLGGVGELSESKDLEAKGIDKSIRSPSVTSVYSALTEPVDPSQSPSITRESADSNDVQAMSTDKSTASSATSVTGVPKGQADRSKSPSIIDESPDLKDMEVKGTRDESRSPSVTSVPGESEGQVDRSKSPSISRESVKSPDLKEVDSKAVDKSRSPISTPGVIKETLAVEGSEPPSVKDMGEKMALDKSRSRSTTSILGECVVRVDHLKSPSIAGELPHLKDAESKGTDSRSRSPSVTSITGGVYMETMDRKSVDKSSIPGEAEKSSYIKHMDETDTAKSLSPAGEKEVIDSVSASSVVVAEVGGEAATVAVSETMGEELTGVASPLQTGNKLEIEESSSTTASRFMEKGEKVVLELEKERYDRPQEDDKLSCADSPASETAVKDGSRSQSVVETGDKTPSTRSRAASVYEEKTPGMDEEKSSESSGRTEDWTSVSIATTKVIDKVLGISDGTGKVTYAVSSGDASEGTKQQEDEQEDDIVKVTAEKKADIEKYILEEYIWKKRKITSIMIEKIVMSYSVPEFVVIDIIETVLAREREREGEGEGEGETGSDSILDLVDYKTKSSVEARETIALELQKKLKIEKYIMDEYVAKRKKITPIVLDEISAMNQVPRPLLNTIVDEIIVKNNLQRIIIMGMDVKKAEDEPKREIPMPSKSTSGIELPGSGVAESGKTVNNLKSSSVMHVHEYRDAKDASGGSTSPSLCSEPIASDKSTQDSPARSEPRIDEEISISEEKRTEVEGIVEGEYIRKAKKITDQVLEEIIVRTFLPRYIILEIIEEIILKKQLSRDSVMGVEIYREDEPADESYEKEDDRYEKTRYDYPDTKVSAGAEASVSDYPINYESQFHKAFVCGITEIRTTHITTLSGKSTPDMTRDGTPDSTSEPTASTVERIEDKYIGGKAADTHVSPDTAVSSSVPMHATESDAQTVHALLKESKIGRSEVADVLESDAVAAAGIIKYDDQSDDATGDKVIMVKKIIKREMVEQQEPEMVTETVMKQKISDEGEPETTIRKIIKREIIEQREPVVATNLIERDVIVPDDVERVESSTEVEDREPGTKIIEAIRTETQKTEIISDIASSIIGGLGRPVRTAAAVIESDGSREMPKSDEIPTKPGQPEGSLKEGQVFGESMITSHRRADEGSKAEKKTVERDGKDTVAQKDKLPASPLVRDITCDSSGGVQLHPSRSLTGTPEGYRSGEIIRTIITTTKTVSDDGEIVTTTREVTETTNEKGETVVLAEKVDVKVDEYLPSRDAAESAISSIIDSIKSSELESDNARKKTNTTEGGLHGSEKEQRSHSDDGGVGVGVGVGVGQFSSTTHAQQSAGTSQQLEPSIGKEEISVGFSAAAMSSSFYGELPAVPPQISAMKTFQEDVDSIRKSSDPIPIQADYTFKRFTVEKEYAGGYEEKADAKRYVDEADLDFEKALMERKEMKEPPETLGRGMSPRYTNGSVRQEISDGRTGESSEDTTADSKKDPLDGWGTPLGLPSPIPPHKFNLKFAAAIQSSDLGAALDNDVRRQHFDPTKDWGEPLRLPSPAPTTNEISNKGTPGTPKKEKKQARKILSENLKNKKRSESPGKNEKKMKDSRNKIQPVYMDLTYVPHHGNSYYTSLEFFKRIRARYYVFSGTEPSREVYDALLEAKRTWEDKDLEVTMIPTYDTDTLGYWVADNEEALAANHIDLSPSASRCTINLQDHETSCSAYRLEF